jgi:hypothetical protein
VQHYLVDLRKGVGLILSLSLSFVSSPDAVMLTKQGLLLALERDSITTATKEWLETDEADAWRKGENMTIGLRAFATKQKPQYQNPAAIVKKNSSRL